MREQRERAPVADEVSVTWSKRDVIDVIEGNEGLRVLRVEMPVFKTPLSVFHPRICELIRKVAGSLEKFEMAMAWVPQGYDSQELLCSLLQCRELKSFTFGFGELGSPDSAAPWLHVTECSLVHATIEKPDEFARFLALCPKLTSLSLEQCRIVQVPSSGVVPRHQITQCSLKKVPLKDDQLSRFLSLFPSLHSLALAYCDGLERPRIVSSTLRRMEYRSWPWVPLVLETENLKELRLVCGSNVEVVGVNELEALDVGRMCGADLREMPLRKINTLKWDYTESSESLLEPPPILEHCHKLEISGSAKITEMGDLLRWLHALPKPLKVVSLDVRRSIAQQFRKAAGKTFEVQMDSTETGDGDKVTAYHAVLTRK